MKRSFTLQLLSSFKAKSLLIGLLLAGLMQGISLEAQTYCTPSYKGPGFSGTGKTTSFYTHILEVHLADLNNILAAPTINPSPSYADFTNLSTDLVPGATYPISIQLGNGANPQYMAVWIDWNQDQIFAKSERLFTRFDPANKGDHQIHASFTVPLNAAIGTTRMRVATRLGIDSPIFIPDPCINNTYINDWSQDFQDYSIKIVKQDVQVYQSSNARQPDQTEVVPGSSDNMILQVVVSNNTAGILSPITAGDFKFSLKGSTNPFDISGAKLYYSGKDPRYSVAKQVGTTVSTPSTYFTIKSGQKLQPGDNYFWLAYDISNTAIRGNIIDAEVYSVDVAGDRTPDTISPPGNRKVGYCPAHGEQNSFVFVYNVNFNTINNYSYPGNIGGYGNYTKLSTRVYRGQKYKLAVMSGNGFNWLYTRTWIDFNGDGDFNDAGENVMFDSLLSSNTSFSYGPDSIRLTIPSGAKIGPTRMRVESFYKPNPDYIKPSSDPCRNPVVIGEVEDYTVVIAEDGQPVANFKADTVCLGSATNFADSSYTFGSYKINSYSWDFGDGDTSNLKNPKHTYSKAGVYISSLTVNTNLPGTPSTMKRVVVVNSPKADFINLGTVHQTNILLADRSTGGSATSWYWDFGDPASGVNDTSSLENPFHNFDTAGTYKVKLVITMAGGCRDSITKSIKIVTAIPPVANFSASTFNPYVTEQTNLKDLSLNKPTSWSWAFSPTTITYITGTSSSQNPSVSFDKLTTYKVTLTVSNSAGSDTISRFFITRDYKKPTANFTANTTFVKAGQAISFLDLSKNDPTSWLWKLGNGDTSTAQNPIYTYKNTGKYNISLNIKNPAGSDSITKDTFITVSNNYVMCQSDASFSPLYAGNISDSGDSTGYFNFSNCGFLIKPDCSGPITIVFDSFYFLPHDYVQVYDGEDNNGTPLFSGVGFSGSGPGSVIAKSGAMFIVESTDGFNRGPGFRAKWFAVPNSKPKAAFSMDSAAYANSPVAFTNNTLIGVNNQYFWDFNNDGTIDSYDKDALFTFSKAGTYKAKLLVVNCKGRDSTYRTVKVVNPTAAPIADFTSSADTITLNDTVTFYNHSKNGPSRFAWSFNPDSAVYQYTSSSGTPNVSVSFTAAGAYDVTLKASNSFGTGTTTKHAYIYVKDAQNMCSTTLSTASSGVLYDDGGAYNDYKNSASCRFRISPCAQQLFLHFNYYDIYTGDVINVYDGIDNSGILLTTYTGGAGSSLATFTSRSGSFYIEETSNADGVTGPGFEAQWSTVPYPKPSAAFTAPDTAYTGGSPAHFDAIDPNADSWNWDFNGDGITDTSVQNARYQYNKTGTYKVRLVTGRCSATDTAYKTVIVIDPTKAPVADFTADITTANIGDPIHLTDLSKNGPNTWKWVISPKGANFVAGTTASSQDPIVTFFITGKFTVKLVVSNKLGADSITKTFYLNVFRYCIPVIYNVGSDVGFSRVKIGAIDNISGVSQRAYSDYTRGTSTRLELNGTYSIHTERLAKTPAEVRKVWIDYNQNGSFNDKGELVVIDTVNTAKTSWTDSFTVPKTAKQGATRMRLGAGLNVDSVNSCGPNVFGEYEDYRVIIGTDITPPIITIIGSNPVSIEVGHAFIDSGATAFDAIDGDVTSFIKTSSTVDTGKVGTYYVTYTVTDSAGNKATAIRKVIITKDKTPPVVSLVGANPEKIEVFYPYVELGAIALDNHDGNVSKNVSIDISEVDTARVGTYHVYYTAVDNSGNFAAQVKRTVIVMDTVAPIITLSGPDTLLITIHTPYVEPGASVNDNYWPALKATISGKVDTAKAGTYILTYTAKDGSGNIAKVKKRVVIVQKANGIASMAPDGWMVSVFPVPAKEYFNIHLTMLIPGQVSFELINTLGQVIETRDAGMVQEANIQFQTAKLRSGLYFIRITSSEGIYVREVQVLK
jgi:PKD repeat protein